MIRILLLPVFLLCLACPAFAIPVISLDMDALTPGIQRHIFIQPGDIFAAEVIYTGDGVTTYDSFTFDVGFNPGLNRTSLAQSDRTTFPFEQDIGGQNLQIAYGGAFDIFCEQQKCSPCPLSLGNSIVRGGFAPPAPFHNSFGGISLRGMPFDTEEDGVSGRIVTIKFQDNGLQGTNTFAVVSATLTKQTSTGVEIISAKFRPGFATTIPEPSGFLLMGTGLAGLWWWRRYSKKQKRGRIYFSRD